MPGSSDTSLYSTVDNCRASHQKWCLLHFDISSKTCNCPSFIRFFVPVDILRSWSCFYFLGASEDKVCFHQSSTHLMSQSYLLHSHGRLFRPYVRTKARRQRAAQSKRIFLLHILLLLFLWCLGSLWKWLTVDLQLIPVVTVEVYREWIMATYLKNPQWV